VLTPSARHGAQRLYREEDLRRIGLAYLCRVVGMMPLDGAAVVASGRTDLKVWRHTIREEIARLDKRVEQAAAARDYLDHLLRCEDDDITQCPYFDIELATRTPAGPSRHPDLVTAARAAHARVHRHRDEKAGDGHPRDEKAQPLPVCPSCERPVPRTPRGRPRTYCSHACQQRAYRARRKAEDEHRADTGPRARPLSRRGSGHGG
jgi:hypothetical protein